MPKTSLRNFLNRDLSYITKTLGASDNELTSYDLEDSSIYESVPDNVDPFAVFFLRSLALFTSQKNQPDTLKDEFSTWRKQLISKSRERKLEDNLTDLGFKDVILPLPGTWVGGIKANLGRIFKENSIDSISSSYIEKIYQDLNAVRKLLDMAEPVSFESFESFSSKLLSPHLMNDETKQRYYATEKNKFLSKRTPILLEYFPAMLDAFPENIFSKEIRERMFKALIPRAKVADDFILLNEIFMRINEPQQQQLVDNINLKQCLLKNKDNDLKPEDAQNIIRLFLKYFNMKTMPDAEKSKYLSDIVDALSELTKSQQHYQIILHQLQGSIIYNTYDAKMRPLINKYNEILKAIEHFPNITQNANSVIWNLAKTTGSAKEIIEDINAYKKRIEEPISNPMNFLWNLATRSTSSSSNSSSRSISNLAQDKVERNNFISQLFKKS